MKVADAEEKICPMLRDTCKTSACMFWRFKLDRVLRPGNEGWDWVWSEGEGDCSMKGGGK